MNIKLLKAMQVQYMQPTSTTLYIMNKYGQIDSEKKAHMIMEPLTRKVHAGFMANCSNSNNMTSFLLYSLSEMCP